jgi:hypothetical protein
MRLSGKLKQQIHDALLSAFPTRAALAQMLTFHMDVTLDAIVGNGGLSQQVFELVVWAEAQGREQELMASARKSVPGNTALQEAEGGLETLRLGLNPKLLELVVETFLDGYHRRVELEMLLRFELDKNLNEIATTGSLRDDVRRLIITARKESWLENLLDAAIAGRPQNPKFQHLREEMLKAKSLE